MGRIKKAAGADEKSASATESKKGYSLYNIWVITLVLKLSLIVSYHSTDFDVHRNWLAITKRLPVAQWYTENTSQWTLDYPPFFAYFEWFLAQFVPPAVAHDGCLDLVEKGQYSMPTLYFQRFTVILSEILLFVALQWYINTTSSHNKRRAYVAASSLVLSPGLLLIDHIHFQYNGMMYGILVLVINCARLKQYLWCGFLFAVLLCFKHIYLYLAPAVFVFLLRAYCLDLKPYKGQSVLGYLVGLVRWKNLLKLGSTVLGVFAVAFAPFIYHGVMPQLLARLFPFSRGLTHAYWAPNSWAIYSFLDRLLIQVYKRVPLTQVPLQMAFKFNPALLLDPNFVNSSTRGIVGDIEFLILPTITPQLTFILTLFYQIMALIPLFLQPNFNRFVGSLVLCGYSSFLFGWHVHEKAILIVIFPITFLVCSDRRLLGPFNLLTSCAYISLFPLIYTPNEWVIKSVYTILWYIIYYFNFRKVVNLPKNSNGFILDRMVNSYILGLFPLIIVVTLIDLFETRFDILKKLEFLKLMMISVYCGIGIICSWNGFNWLYFVSDEIWEDTTST